MYIGACRNIPPVSSGWNSKPRKRPISTAFRLLLLVSCLAYYLTLKMEVICTSETSGSELHAITTQKIGLTLKLILKKLQVTAFFFSIYLILLSELGPGVYSASNRNEYQKQKNNVSGD
jgi:hypothetical protein